MVQASYQSSFFLTNSINTRVLAERMLNVSMHVSITMQKVRQMVFFVKLHRLSDFLACCNAAKNPPKLQSVRRSLTKESPMTNTPATYLLSLCIFVHKLLFSLFSFLSMKIKGEQNLFFSSLDFPLFRFASQKVTFFPLSHH